MPGLLGREKRQVLNSHRESLARTPSTRHGSIMEAGRSLCTDRNVAKGIPIKWSRHSLV